MKPGHVAAAVAGCLAALLEAEGGPAWELGQGPLGMELTLHGPKGLAMAERY